LTSFSNGPAAFKVALASGNRNKRAEFADFFKSEALARFNIELVSIESLAETQGSPPDAEETGASYEENAAIKAQAWADFFGIPAIADDSGLEARHLSWRPGIFSARAAPGTDAERTEWLLGEMSGASDRRARFVACIVIAFPSNAMLNERKEKRRVCGRRYFASEGICWGNIANKPSGADGFGYDPVFIPDDYEKTFSELGKELKSRISHRAKAMAGVAQMAASVIKYWSVREQISWGSAD
jgi:XTP/dITP diphosphohydrolase